MAALGKFYVTIAADIIDGPPATSAAVTVKPNVDYLRDPDADKFYLPKLPETNGSKSLPATLELPTDVTSGTSSVIGYTVTVRVPGAEPVVSTFAARAADLTISLADIPNDLAAVDPSDLTDTALAARANDSSSTFGQAITSSIKARVQPLVASDYVTSGSTFNLAAMVADMGSTGRPGRIPAGAWTPAAAVQLNDISNTKRYHFFGDGPGVSRITLPSGLGTGYLLGANVDAGGVAVNSSLYAHPEVSFEGLSFYGTASPNATAIRVHQRGVSLRNVNFHSLKYGVVTSGYCDRTHLTNIYADGMTTGGWVFQQTGFGDGMIVDGFMSYGSPGISLTKMNGGRLSGLVSTWLELIESDVEVSAFHLEGDAAPSTTPLIVSKGSRVYIPNGVFFTRPSGPAIQIDDNDGTGRRHSSVTIGHETYFQQRLDDPGSAVGNTQGVAVSIKNPAKNTELRMEGVRARLFRQNATTSDVGFEYTCPIVTTPNTTTDEINLLTVINARRQMLAATCETRYRNGAWEVDLPDLLSAMRTTRRVTAALFVSPSAESTMGTTWSTLTAGTYYYKAYTTDPENRTTPVSAEASVTVTAGQAVKVSLNTGIAPAKVTIYRGTTAGSPSAYAEVWVANETAWLYDQGNAIGGQVWKTTGLPTPPTFNSTYDGFVIRSTGAAVLYGTTPPTDGTWAASTQMWNTNAAAGGSPGWVCTTAGTPGTWKAMGNLAA